jgi:dTDP-4-amino-4,6-dideoxygalactose transaminase
MTADRPALLGGEPLFPQGPPPWPRPDESIRQALETAFANGTWGQYQGGNVEQLEARLRTWTGLAHALTCASGTLAVEVALRAAGVRPGDEVVLAAYDYGGNFLSIHAVGARPVLVDIAPHNWNLCPLALRSALGPRTRAVVVSHLHGGLVPMRDLVEQCRAREIVVVEDAAQATGAVVEGRCAGTWGDVGVYSFGGSKLLAAGRGGALVTARADLHQRARLVLGRGNNLVAPLSELQAAVLLPQFDLLAARHEQRLAAVQCLESALADLPGLRLFRNEVDGSPAYYKVGLQYDEDRFGLSRPRLVAAARAEGIALDEGFRALHAGRSANRFSAMGPLPEAERAQRGCVVLHHPVLLEDAMIDRVAAALRRIHAWADRLG